jgi:hypothetical protein
MCPAAARWVEVAQVRHRPPHTALAEHDGAGNIPSMVRDTLMPTPRTLVGTFESRPLGYSTSPRTPSLASTY